MTNEQFEKFLGALEEIRDQVAIVGEAVFYDEERGARMLVQSVDVEIDYKLRELALKFLTAVKENGPGLIDFGIEMSELILDNKGLQNKRDA